MKMVEIVAGAGNRFFYAFFCTCWAAIYLVVYFRNWPFVTVVAFGLILDIVRTNRMACGWVWSVLFFNRFLFSATFLVLTMACSFAAIKLNIRELTIGSAYLHFEQAKLHADTTSALFVYLVESAGVGVGFAALVAYSLRQSAGKTFIERRPVLTKPRFQELWTFLFLLSLVAATFLYLGIDFRHSGTSLNTAYDPARNYLQLGFYSISPMLLSVGAKYWLFIVDVMKSDRATIKRSSV